MKLIAADKHLITLFAIFFIGCGVYAWVNVRHKKEPFTYYYQFPESDSLMQTIVRKQDSILTLLRNQSGYFDSGYDSLDGTKK